MNKIIYDGRTFAAGDIDTVRMHMATSLISNRLEANTLTAVVRSGDPSITRFVRNTPLTFYHNGKKKFIAYVQTIDRVGPQKYKIYGTSAVGRLMERRHPGGIYTGQTAGEIIDGICGPIPHIVKGNLRSVKLYGWLPYVNPPRSSARDNLSQVLFAIGATVKTDLDGVLHIEGLWDGVSGVLGKERTYKGASVKYTSPVSGVVVTEHQFAEGGDSVKLFEGTTAGNDVITFASPMYNLSAAGFTILEQGANYAVLSAGTGTLTGNQYIHNTRQISKNIDGAAEENVKTFSNATLVSLVNSTAVAERMANYYACTETINGDMLLDGQSTGDVVEAFHPYAHNGVHVCIESMDITASGKMRGKVTERVGFLPIRANLGYFDKVERIQADGEWAVPAGVTTIRAVLIGGGDGGWSGLPGESIKAPEPILDTDNNSDSMQYSSWRTFRAGGVGGVPGVGGKGGKVYVVSMDVVPGTVFPIKIGPGGIGGVYDAAESKPGTPGGATTFGQYSSDMGTSSPGGFFEETSGESYGTDGLSGIKGGNGSGQARREDQSGYDPVETGESITVDGVTWHPGANHEQEVIQDKGGAWNNKVNGSFTAVATGSFGGGCAVGNNGGDGFLPTDPNSTAQAEVYGNPPTFLFSRGAKGGSGADAKPPKPQTKIGVGGTGGHGGGGGGSPGQAQGINVVSKTSGATQGKVYVNPQDGLGGNGSDGGVGANGGVFIFYSLPKKDTTGPVFDKNKKTVIDREHRRFIM